MRLLPPLILIVLLASGALAFLKIQRPDMFYSLMISFNISPPGIDSAAEQDRLDHIRLLPLSDEKKQFLIQHTIFMGASESMVELALGKPKQAYFGAPTAGGGTVHKWLYYFPGDSKPTLLVFENAVFNSAYRVSAHDGVADAPPVDPTTPSRR